jgi:polyhydroxybutyrate depolymerase
MRRRVSTFMPTGVAAHDGVRAQRAVRVVRHGRQRHPRLGVGLLCASFVGAVGCSSGAGSDASNAAGRMEGGAGGEPPASANDSPGVTGTAAAGSGGGTPESVSEGIDPSRIGNVEPVPGESPAPATPSPGCGQLALLTSGAQSLDVDGVTRTYVLDLPSRYDGTTPKPIVFAFHGATTSGEFFRSAFYGNLLSTMGGDAIVVHPDALGDPTAWNNSVDLPFFDALLAELSDGLCLDRARVFATGHSSGGFFTNTLGCQRGDVLRAIAPVAGGGPFGFGNGACTGEVAVWLAHGENDPMVPFQTGVDSRDRWLEANGCSEATSAVEPAPCVEYSGCTAGLPVSWCVHEDGHNWPDFAPEGIWSFFRSL